MAELAEVVGISRPFLSHIENGKRECSLAILQRAARALGVSACELLGEPAPGVEGLRPDQALLLQTLEQAGPAQAIQLLLARLTPRE